MSDKIFQAMEFAQSAHRGQYRKGTKLPYIIHPLGVMEILLRENAPEEVVIAGILHDTLEDTATTAEELEQNFGKRVKELVLAATEPEHDAPWETRKQHTIEFIKNITDEEVLLLSCADKLHNLNSMIEDYARIGDELWHRFKRGKNEQKWYYEALAKAYTSHNLPHPIFKEYSHKVDQFFAY